MTLSEFRDWDIDGVDKQRYFSIIHKSGIITLNALQSSVMASREIA